MSFLSGPFDVAASALFERKPDVPNFHWTDLVQTQLDTAKGNLGVLPRAEEIGTDVNAFMRGERAKTLAGIPGLGDIENETVANLRSWLAGELPSDVQSSIQRAANAKAFAGGYAGSGMGRNLTARDLGLTSLNLAQSAVPLSQQYLQGEYAMRKTPEFDPTQMFISPMQAAQFNAQQQQQKFARDWLAERISAQPEPWQQALMNAQSEGGSWIEGIVSNVAGQVGSKAVGGMMA